MLNHQSDTCASQVEALVCGGSAEQAGELRSVFGTLSDLLRQAVEHAISTALPTWWAANQHQVSQLLTREAFLRILGSIKCNAQSIRQASPLVNYISAAVEHEATERLAEAIRIRAGVCAGGPSLI